MPNSLTFAASDRISVLRASFFVKYQTAEREIMYVTLIAKERKIQVFSDTKRSTDTPVYVNEP
jgi:hypothetical protein